MSENLIPSLDNKRIVEIKTSNEHLSEIKNMLSEIISLLQKSADREGQLIIDWDQAKKPV